MSLSSISKNNRHTIDPEIARYYLINQTMWQNNSLLRLKSCYTLIHTSATIQITDLS